MRYFGLILIIFFVLPLLLSGQTDIERPEAPQLRFVTVDPNSAATIIRWAPGPSEDVAGYIVYSYVDNEGFALDTINDPLATEYRLNGTGPSYFSETFVAAAFDYSGNVSPLSNSISTIHVTVVTDSCNRKLDLSWNGYTSEPVGIIKYIAWFSVDGGPAIQAGETNPDEYTLTLNDFTTDAEYCFTISAILEEGPASSSNRACILTSMERPPEWINADYATVDDSRHIDLSFTADPLTDINSYRLERRSGSENGFVAVASFRTQSGMITYTDSDAEPELVNVYRLAALNNCGLPVEYSNYASNIVLNAGSNADGTITLTWNRYVAWAGETGSVDIYCKTGDGYSFLKNVSPQDTTAVIDYNLIMNSVTDNEVCFNVVVTESSNPHGINGSSRSNGVCMAALENITVPDLFTPDGDLKNDLFRPFLSFIPTSYALVITDRRGRTLFESGDHSESWNGTFKGSRLPRDVYLWLLKVTTPSGKTISRTGTITIYRNSD